MSASVETSTRGELGDEDVAVVWPPVPGCEFLPRWTGSYFLVGEEKTRILRYPVKDAGWNDEMAALVDREVDPEKPVGIASRRFVVEQLERAFGTQTAPTLLEIGSSTGFLLRDIRRVMPAARLIGSDYAYPALESLASKMPDVPLIQMDLTASPLPSESFDVVVALNVLEHIQDDAAAVGQIYRMLKPNGIAILEVPAGPALYDGFDRRVGHFRRYRMKDFVQLAQRAGFEVTKKSHLGFLVYPAFWLGKKRNRLLVRSPEQMHELTLQTLRAGRRSVVLGLALAIEAWLRDFLYFPFGIRCLLTVQKRKK